MIKPDRLIVFAAFGGLIAIGIAVGTSQETDSPRVASDGRDAATTKPEAGDQGDPPNGQVRDKPEPTRPLEDEPFLPGMSGPELKQPSWVGQALRQLGVVLATSRIRWLAGRDGPGTVEMLANERVRAAQERLSTIWAFASEGTVTTNRFLDASRELMEAEVAVAASRDEAISAVQRQLDRINRFVHKKVNNPSLGLDNQDALIIAEARDAHAQAALTLARLRTQGKR
jgi:hypothetical protein